MQPTDAEKSDIAPSGSNYRAQKGNDQEISVAEKKGNQKDKVSRLGRTSPVSETVNAQSIEVRVPEPSLPERSISREPGASYQKGPPNKEEAVCFIKEATDNDKPASDKTDVPSNGKKNIGRKQRLQWNSTDNSDFEDSKPPYKKQRMLDPVDGSGVALEGQQNNNDDDNMEDGEADSDIGDDDRKEDDEADGDTGYDDNTDDDEYDGGTGDTFNMEDGKANCDTGNDDDEADGDTDDDDDNTEDDGADSGRDDNVNMEYYKADGDTGDDKETTEDDEEDYDFENFADDEDDFNQNMDKLE